MAAIRNAAGPTLFKRFFGLVENQPLYVMVGLACGLAVYTPIRHITHASDIALDPSARDAGEVMSAGGGRTLQKAYDYRRGGILQKAARVHDWPQVFPLVGVEDRSHWEHKPLYLPKEVPQPEAA